MFAPAEDKKLVVTYTGEPAQPTRLYYRVLNPKTVVRALNKLRCIHYVSHLDIWQWLYESEAKKIRFDTSYNKIPKQKRPVALGWMFLRGEDLIIDLRSFDRALKAIDFFDTRINRRAAQVYKMRIVNRFFDGRDPEIIDTLETPYDHFFDEREDEVALPKADELVEQLEAIQEQYEDEEEQEEAISQYLFQDMDEPSPELEEIPIHVYEEGLGGLQLALMTRHVEANAYWTGDTSFSKADMLARFASEMLEDLEGFVDEDEEPGEESAIDVAAIAVESETQKE